jgi:hypothetical protein
VWTECEAAHDAIVAQHLCRDAAEGRGLAAVAARKRRPRWRTGPNAGDESDSGEVKSDTGGAVQVGPMYPTLKAPEMRGRDASGCMRRRQASALPSVEGSWNRAFKPEIW